MENTDKRPLSGDNIKSLLSQLGGLVAGDLRTEIGQTTTLLNSGESDNDETSESHLPAWATTTLKSQKDIQNVFVEAVQSTDTWHAIPEKEKDGSIRIRYQYGDSDLLDSGATKNEQAISLDNIDNHFSLDEWDLIVKPILERHVKSIELRKLTKVVNSNREKSEKQIKKLLPQVFYAGEINESDIMNSTVKEYSKRIRDLLTEINTNPSVLKGWIRELLEESDPVEIKTSNEGVKAYKKFHKNTSRKRILQKFSQSEDSLDKYVDTLADKISKIGEQLLRLNSSLSEGIYSSEKVKQDFEETPYFRKKLGELTEKAARQLKYKKGMVSIVGDMGTGKNYLVEYFAAKTNRPFFYFPCSHGMDAADLGFHFEFKKGESFVVPSALARGLQTKNACILIDEPNSLPPEVIAGLHGLADHNRSFVYNGIEFKAAEGVVIIMTMNPATYSHVKDTPAAMADRTLGEDMVMSYPPFTMADKIAQEHSWNKQEKEEAIQKDNDLDTYYLCDEALVLRNTFPKFKALSQEEFTHLWNAVVNGEGITVLGNKADELMKFESIVMGMFTILKICKKWRQNYEEGYMMRTISLRGSNSVMEYFLHTKDVKKAFLDLYKPNSMKYDGGIEDYEMLEQILNNVMS